jgi:Phage P22-like portal protein
MSEKVPGPSSDVTQLTLTGDPIVEEARKRFNRASEWESVARQRFLEDLRFAYGDSDNGDQWPNAVRQARDTDARPCLTINLVRQHNNMIANEARKNKSSPHFLGLGNGATSESASVLGDIYRHIEVQSQAQTAYAIGREYMISGGIGWWRLVTRYSNDKSFDQEIYIEQINDPLSVYIDCDVVKTRSCLDAQWGLVFDEVPEDEFGDAYPEFAELRSQQPLGVSTVEDEYVSRKIIRLAEYFRKVPVRDQLVSLVHDGKRHVMRDSELRKLLRKADYDRIIDHAQTRIRDVVDHQVEWYLIAGERIIDQTIWPGKYIPLIPCKGEESIIDGRLDRKGHTRYMKDAQRLFNYNASAQVEFVALQGKTPWVAPAMAIEGFESVWNTANLTNHSVLPYNHVDPEGGTEVPIPPPQRTQPPTASPAYQAGMETAFNQMMMASGQWQNQMGMMGNERTGAAIKSRKAQSDTATYHFQDYYEEALVTTAIQVLDMIPKIYVSKQIMRIMADDGVDYDLEIDPTLRQAYLEEQQHNGTVIKRIFNPSIGIYDVAPSVGPTYGSRREEAQEALTLILTQAPNLVPILGDLLVGSLDFDKAQEASRRLRRMVPPQALGQGPTQNEQMLMAQVQQLSAALAESLQKQAKEQIKVAGHQAGHEIEAYDAETKRLGVISKMMPMDQSGMEALVNQLVQDALKTNIQGLVTEQQGEIQDSVGEASPPMEGAMMAPDGQWYAHDHLRPGKYIQLQRKGGSNGGP